MKLVIVVTFLLAVGLSSAVAGPIYDRRGNYLSAAVRNSDGSVSGVGGTINGWKSIGGRTYDANGRLHSYVIGRGNTMRHYNARGRLTGVTVRNGSMGKMYDARGRFIGTVDLR